MHCMRRPKLLLVQVNLNLASLTRKTASKSGRKLRTNATWNDQDRFLWTSISAFPAGNPYSLTSQGVTIFDLKIFFSQVFLAHKLNPKYSIGCVLCKYVTYVRKIQIYILYIYIYILIWTQNIFFIGHNSSKDNGNVHCAV